VARGGGGGASEAGEDGAEEDGEVADARSMGMRSRGGRGRSGRKPTALRGPTAPGRQCSGGRGRRLVGGLQIPGGRRRQRILRAEDGAAAEGGGRGG
jgi:hypothetical protein